MNNMMIISKQSRDAAAEIVSQYEDYLCSELFGNQDKWCVTETIAMIIEKHTSGEPAWLSEALNSGDGVYRP